MGHRLVNADLLSNELDFTASRSGGPGGQNVNKVNSRITLRFDIAGSQILTEEEKSILLRQLSSSITKEGLLQLSSQESRSQLDNKQMVIAKFDAFLTKAFQKKKKRKKSKPTQASVQKRIKSKKLLSEKKKWRQKPE
jgi:ribosome-associated protein